MILLTPNLVSTCVRGSALGPRVNFGREGPATGLRPVTLHPMIKPWRRTPWYLAARSNKDALMTNKTIALVPSSTFQ